MAKMLSEKIEASEYFELLSPPNFNVVCFTIKTKRDGAYLPDVADFLSRLTNDGKVFMTPTVYQNRAGIRTALCNWRTTEMDIEIAWDAAMSCRVISRKNSESKRRIEKYVETKTELRMLHRDLTVDSREAIICTLECTFCLDCVDTKLSTICPN